MNILQFRSASPPMVRVAARPRVLFVCTANICRSPMAEGVLRRLLKGRGIAADIESAGTHDYRLGMPPHPSVISVTKLRGYDLTHMISRQVSAADFAKFDLLVAMDREHVAFLTRMAPLLKRSRIRLLMDFSDLHRGEDIADPYGRNMWAFNEALSQIDLGCRGLARAIAASLRGSVPRRADRVVENGLAAQTA